MLRTNLLLLLSLLITACVDTETAPGSPPYPPSQLIKAVEFYWDTHQRQALGSDNWPVTWGTDGHQYTAWGDGGGFGGSNRRGRVSLGVARVEGDAKTYRGHNIWGGHQSAHTAEFGGKSYAILMVDRSLYMWVSPGSGDNNYRHAVLAVSRDNGASWQLADWHFAQQDGLVIPAFLQMGPGYQGPNMDYVYSYFIEPQQTEALGLQRPGRVMLLRAPRDQLLDRAQYEFFAGVDEHQQATWSKQIAQRKAVFEDPAGVGWTLSVSYNDQLKRYLLATEHTQSFQSNLALYESSTPWGPWRTVYYGKLGVGQIASTAFYYNFSNQWTTGRHFVLIFTGTEENDSWNTVEGTFHLHNDTATDSGAAATN